MKYTLLAACIFAATAGPAAAQQFTDSAGNVSVRRGDTIHSYDSAGRLLGMGTRRGNVWAFRYTNGSRHTYTTTRSGSATTIRGKGFYSRVVDEGGGAVTVYERGKRPAAARRTHD